MRRWLRGLTESDWRTIDKVLAALLVVGAIVDVSTSPSREGPLAANIAVVTIIALSFAWHRSRPLVTVFCAFGGFLVLAIFLTQPPDLFVAIVVLLATGYSAGRHLAGRRSVFALVFGAVVVVTISIIFDPGDIFFPVTFFWIVPWLAGRTLRNQTMLARELAEKAERAEHAREEDERRAIALERSRIARELHDVLAHNLSVMVVQASAARRIVERNPEQAVEVAALIERTGREALAEIRHLFGAVRRGEGEDLSGPASITRVDELARRARAAGLKVELRVLGEAVPLPPGIDLTAYRIVQEALTNALKHAGSARASVTVAYEPNEVVLSVEDDGEGPREADDLSDAGGGHGLVGMRERAALYGGLVQAGRRRGGGFAVRARLPTRPLVPGAQLSAVPKQVPA
jgi:signal transduction histidine kinase